MKSRERVLKALSHVQSDRVPLDFGAIGQTGISATVVVKLRKALGLDKQETPIKIVEPYQMLGEIADDLMQKLGVDCIGLWGRTNIFGFQNKDWKPWRMFDGTPVLVPGLFNTEPAPNGDILMYPQGDKSVPPSGRMPKGGFYFDAIVRQEPIDENNLNVKDNLEEFGEISEDELKFLDKQVNNLYRNTDYAIAGSFGGTAFGDVALVPATYLKHPKGIRDIEEWYISLLTRKAYICDIFQQQAEIALKNLERIRQAVLDKICVINVSGTDFGMQRGPFISIELYRELFRPVHKKVNDWIHKNTKWKIFMHSCGSIEPLIPELIEAGFDILNPVQCSADNMDPEHLKKQYGSRVVFWGGGIETQTTLSCGSAEDVRREVKERIRIFKQGGGFVFNTVHNIQPTTPIENVLAMIETLAEYR
ncbi:MAG: uroporphyrinogen decarboxylase family protein [Sedimentisphaerales bacterium]